MGSCHEMQRRFWVVVYPSIERRTQHASDKFIGSATETNLMRKRHRQNVGSSRAAALRP